MDSIRQRSFLQKNRLPIALGGLVLLVAILGFGVHMSPHGSSLEIDKAHIRVDTVRYSEFQETILIDGEVLPSRSVHLVAIIPGKVEHVFVENGDFIEKNEAIVVLSNSDLELDILNKETQVHDLINSIQHTNNLLKQNETNRRTQLNEARYQFELAHFEFERFKKLISDSAISLAEFQNCSLKQEFLKTQYELCFHALVNDSLSAISQLKQMNDALIQAKRNLDLMKLRLNELVLKAPISGQLSDFDIEEGEYLQGGSKLAQLDYTSGFKIEAMVDEHYMRRIALHQQATITIEDTSYLLKVTKINPTVDNGFFKLDLEFLGETPKHLKRGQSFRVKLLLSEKSRSLVVSKGAFYHSGGGLWGFVVEGDKAFKRDIQIGRQNETHFELLSGLKAGEVLITSSYSGLNDFSTLKLKQDD